MFRPGGWIGGLPECPAAILHSMISCSFVSVNAYLSRDRARASQYRRSEHAGSKSGAPLSHRKVCGLLCGEGSPQLISNGKWPVAPGIQLWTLAAGRAHEAHGVACPVEGPEDHALFRPWCHGAEVGNSDARLTRRVMASACDSRSKIERFLSGKN